jgi:uncharacterized protein (DUF1015 family)
MEIRPYPSIHYPFDSQLLSKVVCPPYDKVDNEQIKACRASHPHNFIHVIIGGTLEDHAYYESAAKILREWTKTGILVEEKDASFLVYRQTFEVSQLVGDKQPQSSCVITRTGFFALLRLPERDEKTVLPHERTFAEHKADRLQLYRATRGTPEPIFVLYQDSTLSVHRILTSAAPEVTFADLHEHTNQLGFIRDPIQIQQIRDAIETQHLLIADGHHRFETGQNYRDECRQAFPHLTSPQPWDYILVYLTALEDPGLVILPTHRLVKGITSPQVEKLLIHLQDLGQVEQVGQAPTEATLQALASQVEEMSLEQETIGIVTREGLWTCTFQNEGKLKALLPREVTGPLLELPIVWLHRILLDQFLALQQEEGAPERIIYVRTPAEVYQKLMKGDCELAFILRGTRPVEVSRVAEAGYRMPQKSTDFFPKVLSGVTTYLHP